MDGVRGGKNCSHLTDAQNITSHTWSCLLHTCAHRARPSVPGSDPGGRRRKAPYEPLSRSTPATASPTERPRSLQQVSRFTCQFHSITPSKKMRIKAEMLKERGSTHSSGPTTDRTRYETLPSSLAGPCAQVVSQTKGFHKP